MANKYQVKRTANTGVTPNTTNSSNTAYIYPGELAINMADSKLYSSNPAGILLELGSNLTSLTVDSIWANGVTGDAGQVLTSDGSNVYWNSLAALTINLDAQYTWTNNHTFESNVTFNSDIDVSSANVVSTNGNDVSYMNSSRIVFYDTDTESGNVFVTQVNHDSISSAKSYNDANTQDVVYISRNTGLYVVTGQEQANTDQYDYLLIANSTQITIGNTTVNTAIDRQSITIGDTIINTTNVIATNISGNGAAVTSVNAIAVGGNTASDLNAYASSYTDTAIGTANTAMVANADAAYTNSTSYTDTAIGTANTAMVANADAAYTNATSYTDTAIGTANTAMVANASAAYSNAVSYTDTKIGTANTAMIANAAAAYSNATSYTDTKIGTANTAMIANAAAAYTNSVSYVNGLRLDSVTNTSITYVATANSVKTAYDAAVSAYSNSVSYTDTAIGTANTAMAANGDAAYTNSVSYTDTAIGTANTAMIANAAAAYSNAVSYTDTKIGTANTAMIANAAAAYSNAVSYTDGKILTANAAITGNAATAYTNAVSYTDTAIGTANTAMVANADAAYTNATTFAANATNISSGTLAEARLPYRMDQDVRTTDNVEFSDITITGNLTVQGTTTTINTETLEVDDNMIYLNANSTVTNPDLGWAGNYDDGTYHHAGFFRDATDGFFKPFDNYGPEPDANAYIDTTHATFNLAGIWAGSGRYGNTTVYSTINSTSFSGTANNSTYLGGSNLSTIQGQITSNAAAAYSNAVSYTNTKIGTANTAMVANADAAYTNAVSYTDTAIGTAYSNAISYVDTAIGTANTAMIANAAAAYTNAVSYTDTAIGTANTAMAANADAAYTNATTFAANASNISSGTLAAARLPSLYLGTTTIQSTSAAQAVSGITTLAAGNTTITGFANIISDSAVLSVGNSTSYVSTAATGVFPVSNTVANFLGGNSKRWALSATTGSFSGAVSGITTLAAGNTTITGFANVTGDVMSGGNIVPDSDNAGAIGNSTLTWASGHFTNLNIDNLTVSEGGITISNVASPATDASLHIVGSQGGYGRYIQISPGETANTPIINLIASKSAANSEQWWTFGVNVDDEFYISKGVGVGTTGLNIDTNGYLIDAKLKSYSEAVVTNSSATGAVTIDCSLGNFFNWTLTGNITGITFTNVPSGVMYSITIAAKQDAGGTNTITWPASVKWPGGVTPPASTGGNELDIWSLMTYDGGTTWIGSLSVKDAS